MKAAQRHCLIILTSICFLLFCSSVVQAEPSSEVFSMQDAMKYLDIDTLEAYKGHLDEEISAGLEIKSAREWLGEFAQGNWKLEIKELGQSILRLFFREVVANSGLLGKLIILSVLSALLLNLQNAFSKSVSKISYLATFLALSAIALGSFKVALSIAQETITSMVTFMTAMLPQMMVLVAGLGGINTSVMLFPLLMSAATFCAGAIKDVVFPLILMAVILSLLNQMSETVKVERLAKVMGRVAQIALGFFLTIFVGIATLRAVYASVLDNVTLRTTRFITDNAVPLVGKMVGDTIEVAAGYVVMLKHAVSIYGVLIILGIILLPLIKIAVMVIIYKIVAAIVEPMGDARTAAVLDTMSSYLAMILAATAGVALMFFFMIAIIAGMSNGLSMLR
ncbi:MAG TPA: stage III sporulation protein AE [Syntrophomonadaceae bacterium]|nr:stage III sporulation protein AE [Syntrophomonadaceae bacterium]